MSISSRTITTTVTITCDKRSCPNSHTISLVAAGHMLTAKEIREGTYDYAARTDAMKVFREFGWRQFDGRRLRYTYCPDHEPAPSSRMDEVTDPTQ